MISGNATHLLFRSRLEWVRQHDDAQAGTSGVGRHRVGERFELLRHDGDRRRSRGQRSDGVVHCPRGARASVAQTDDCELRAVDEGRELGARALAFVADAVARCPSVHDRTFLLEQALPFVSDPLEAAPGAASPHAAISGRYIRSS